MWTQFNGEHVTGSAKRRRERRLRQWLRHERMTVAMALAESQHHAAARRQSMARAGGWVRDEVHGRVPGEPTPQEPGTQHFFLDDDSVQELGGSRPDRLVDVRPQERVPGRIVEQTVDTVPVVQLLHVPVPQMVDSVVEVLKILDKFFPDVEQVIEVPKILQHTVLQRSSLQESQLAEQLVEVRTPSPALVPEHKLLEVPPILPQLVGFFAGADGTCGGSSRSLRPTGGEWAPLTPSGPPHRGTPPGQGGIQILAAVTLADVHDPILAQVATADQLNTLFVGCCEVWVGLGTMESVFVVFHRETWRTPVLVMLVWGRFQL